MSASDYCIDEKRKESPWWVRSLVYPFEAELLERRVDQIRCEEIDWLKQVQTATTDKPVLTAIKKRLHRLEVAWGYDVVIAFNPEGEKKFHKQGDERTVRRWAMLQSCAKRIVSMTPLSRKEWLGCYGNGKTKM